MSNTTVTAIAHQNGHHPTTVTQTTQRDEFDAAEFENGRESLPYLQLLNHQNPEQSGFFITLENAEAAGFTPNEEWTPHTETFRSGESSEGYRSLLARFLILRKSKLMMFDRESGEFLGAFEKSRYDRASMLLKTRFLVYLITKNKQLLHASPLLLTAKGSFSGSFGEVVRKFQDEMSKAYSAATGAKKPRGDRFMALSILAVRLQPELKGEKKKSWACSVSSYGSPKAEDWRSYFVGYNEPLKEKLLAEFDAWEVFGSQERELEAQHRRQDQTQAAEEPEYDIEPHYDFDDDF